MEHDRLAWLGAERGSDRAARLDAARFLLGARIGGNGHTDDFDEFVHDWVSFVE